MDKGAAVSLSWSPDVLPGFSYAWLGEPERSPVLIRLDHEPEPARAVVIHVHGYNDYFFQEHLAHFFRAQGIAFFAVDLRGAGRAIAARDIPHFMADVAEPGADIQDAVDAVAGLHPNLPLIIHAHSTGGLSAVMWAALADQPALSGLILNSPLFGRRERGIKEHLKFLLPLISHYQPQFIVSHRPSVYATHLHVDGGGRWEFDTNLKRPGGVPARAAWAAAVRRAQQRIARGLGLEVPVLVAHSAESGPELTENPNLRMQDIVVDVNAIATLAPRIGPNVTTLVVDGAIHDLCLADPEPREAYWKGVTAWLDKVLS